MFATVAQVCEKTGELLLCEGQCCGAFHLACISLAEAPKGKFICPECKSGAFLFKSARFKSNSRCFYTPTTQFLKYQHISRLLEFNLFSFPGIHTCFVCKKRGEDVRRCMIPVCGKFYHGECIANFAPTVAVNRGFRCSIHVCLTCFIANPNSSTISKGEAHALLCSRLPPS